MILMEIQMGGVARYAAKTAKGKPQTYSKSEETQLSRANNRSVCCLCSQFSMENMEIHSRSETQK